MYRLPPNGGRGKGLEELIKLGWEGEQGSNIKTNYILLQETM